MKLSDSHVVLLIQIAVVLAIVMLFPPGRKMLGAAVGAVVKLLSGMFTVVFNTVQASAVYVVRQHMIVLRNLRPRITVLPTVVGKTTRRD